MKCLITGATGLLGNNLARHLLFQGHEVRAFVRPPTPRRELEDLELEQFSGELTDESQVQAAMKEVDCVIHSAAIIHFGRKRTQESHNINVNGTESVAKAAAQSGIRMIHISSVDALAAGTRLEPANEEKTDPAKVDCAYVNTKREADQRVMELVKIGLDAVLIYPGLMFGSWDWKPSSGKMLQAIAKSFVPLAPRGGISAVDVVDVCRGIVEAIDHGHKGERYILAGHNMTYLQLWRMMADKLKRPGPWARMGPAFAWGLGKLGDLATAIRGDEGEINSAGIRLSSLYHYYDSAKAMSELNYHISDIGPALDRAIGFMKERQMI